MVVAVEFKSYVPPTRSGQGTSSRVQSGVRGNESSRLVGLDSPAPLHKTEMDEYATVRLNLNLR